MIRFVRPALAAFLSLAPIAARAQVITNPTTQAQFCVDRTVTPWVIGHARKDGKCVGEATQDPMTGAVLALPGFLPLPTSSTLGGVMAGSAPAHQFQTGVGTSGAPLFGQPAATDISGLASSATTDTTNAANVTPFTGPTAPTPKPNLIWYDTSASSTSPIVRIWDSTQWVAQGALNGTTHAWTLAGIGSSLLATAIDGTAQVSLAAFLGTAVDVRLYGAKLDGVTDDSAAWAQAINVCNSRISTGAQAYVYEPAGVSLIKSTHLPQFQRNCGLVGTGSQRSWIKVDPSYSGDIFAWDEAWLAADWFSAAVPNTFTTVSIGTNKAGAKIEGLTVVGNRSSSNVQNAFTFYDRNDFVYMHDVNAYYIPGRAIYVGATQNTPQAYIRESVFDNIRIWQSGTTSLPAVEFNSAGGAGADATDEVDISTLSLLSSAGVSLKIANKSTSSTRLMRFHALRAEDCGSTCIQIGDPSDTGPVHNIDFDQLDLESAQGSANGMLFTSSSAGNMPYQIHVQGTNTTGSENLINIQAGREIYFDLMGAAATGTTFTVGSSAMVGTNITINGHGKEAYWTYNIDPTSISNVHFPTTMVGNPSLPEKVSYQLRKTTTAAGSYVLTLDGSNQVPAAPNSTMNFSVRMIGRSVTNPGNYYSYSVVMGALHRDAAASTTVVNVANSAIFTSNGGTGSGCVGQIAADTTNGLMNVQIFNPNADKWDWTATVEGTITR